MIFVTVGTHTQGFERLVKTMDEFAGSGKIKEKVVMQIGTTKYEPRNCEWFRFESFKNMAERNKAARLVITHSGEGSIILALELKKPVIIVPRYKKFGEHVNDHQEDIAQAIEKEKLGTVVYDISMLEPAIKAAGPQNTAKIRGEKILLISKLKKYINNLVTE